MPRKGSEVIKAFIKTQSEKNKFHVVWHVISKWDFCFPSVTVTLIQGQWSRLTKNINTIYSGCSLLHKAFLSKGILFSLAPSHHYFCRLKTSENEREPWM